MKVQKPNEDTELYGISSVKTGLWGKHTHTQGYCVHTSCKLIKEDI